MELNNLIGGNLQMKRKLIIALAAAMTITLGSVGVVSADDANFAPFIPVNETGIRDGFIWVVDKEAWDEQVLVSPEEGHWETVIDKEAWIEKIEHKEEGHYENGKLISPEKGHYETIVDKEAWDEIVHHEEEGHYEKQNVQVGTKPVYEKEMHVICHSCGGIDIDIAMDPIEGGMSQAYAEHRIWHMLNGETAQTEYVDVDVQVGEEPIYEEKEVWVVDKAAWDETIHHEAETHEEWVVDEEAVYEQIWVVDKEAWTESIEHPAETHQEWKVDKEAVYKTVHHPEEGHWEPIPENPDEQEPETPQNPDEQEPETPQNPDEQDSETPDNNQNNNENNNQNENNSQNNNENTSQNNNSSETNNSQDDSTGKQPPKTGDPTNFASLYALAGSALAGIGAVKLKFRKRK